MSSLLVWVAAQQPASAHVPVVYFAGPTDDWCAVIDGTVGSDIVMLYPGEYHGPCDVRAHLSNVVTEQTTVQSFDPLNPAVFVGSDTDYVLKMTGESLLVMQVLFRDLPEGVDAIRVDDIRVAWVRYAWFDGVPGAGVVQVGPATELSVTDTEFLDVGRPVDLGCGGACAAATVEVSENFVTRGTVGITVAGGSGLVIDNVVTQVGVGIAVDGTGGDLEVVGNLVEASGAAVDVLGGPVVLDANVAMGDPALRSGAAPEIRAVGNTWVAVGAAAVALEGWTEAAGNRFVDNAVLGDLPSLPGVPMEGSVACDAGCFTDAAGWDYFPAEGSPLRAAGVDDDDLGADWCGRVRDDPPAAGAIESYGSRSFGPLAAGFKEDTDCSLPAETVPPPPGTTGPTTEPPSTTGPGVDDPAGDGGAPAPAATGCGCRAGSPAPLSTGLAAVGILAALRRRRR